MAFLTIKNRLAAILESLAGSGKPLQAVFSFSDPSPQAFPCAMLRATGGKEDRLDSANNTQTISFTIRVLARAKNTDDADTQLLGVIDAIAAALRLPENVDTLGGAAVAFSVDAFSEIEGQTDQPITGFDIAVSASTIESIL